MKLIDLVLKVGAAQKMKINFVDDDKIVDEVECKNFSLQKSCFSNDSVMIRLLSEIDVLAIMVVDNILIVDVAIY